LTRAPYPAAESSRRASVSVRPTTLGTLPAMGTGPAVRPTVSRTAAPRVSCAPARRLHRDHAPGVGRQRVRGPRRRSRRPRGARRPAGASIPTVSGMRMGRSSAPDDGRPSARAGGACREQDPARARGRPHRRGRRSVTEKPRPRARGGSARRARSCARRRGSRSRRGVEAGAPTLITTLLSRATTVPAAGSWETTRPALLASPDTRLTSGTRRPAASACCAASCGRPTTLGIVAVPGALAAAPRATLISTTAPAAWGSRRRGPVARRGPRSGRALDARDRHAPGAQHVGGLGLAAADDASGKRRISPRGRQRQPRRRSGRGGAGGRQRGPGRGGVALFERGGRRASRCRPARRKPPGTCARPCRPARRAPARSRR
jgi:hypothetical protein